MFSKVNCYENFVEKRKGRKYRLIRNSYSRDYIYTLKEIYTSILWDCGYYDVYDEVSFAIKYGQSLKEKYTHIVVEDVEKLTKGEIDFVEGLYELTHYQLEEKKLKEIAWCIQWGAFPSNKSLEESTDLSLSPLSEKLESFFLLNMPNPFLT